MKLYRCDFLTEKKYVEEIEKFLEQKTEDLREYVLVKNIKTDVETHNQIQVN